MDAFNLDTRIYLDAESYIETLKEAARQADELAEKTRRLLEFFEKSSSAKKEDR